MLTDCPIFEPEIARREDRNGSLRSGTVVHSSASLRGYRCWRSWIGFRGGVGGETISLPKRRATERQP